MHLIANRKDKSRCLDILETGFREVPGIKWMLGNRIRTSGYLRTFLWYCFETSAAKRGAFISSNKNAVVFFFDLENKRRSWAALLIKLYLVLKILGIRNAIRVARYQHIVAAIRPKKGLYAWFIASDQKAGGLAGMYELKQAMFRLADERGQVIYVETTMARTAELYAKIGFTEYCRIKHPYAEFDICFMKREPYHNTIHEHHPL